MTTFPGSPRLLRGAIACIDSGKPLASAIAFQYNPDTMTRSLAPRTAGTDLDKNARSQLDPTEANRLSGPPKETITLKIEIDATDQLEQADITAVTYGIHPQLAALEMLLYPSSTTVIASSTLSKTGTLEIVPMEAPFTLFVWGAQRILPVRLESMNVEELAYDVNLNPIRAEVSLTMQVLSYADLKPTHIGSAAFMAHQVQKEQMAKLDTLKNINSISKSVKDRIQQFS
jgi:hypothetical protein